MPLFARTFEEILAESLNEVVDNTALTRVSPGSKVRAILEVLSRKMNEAYRTFDLNLARAFLSGAAGRYLDFIGEMLGLPREGTEAAIALANTNSVRFFVESGTFGDINGADPIPILVGTVLSTEDDEAGILYRVIESISLAATDSEDFISVEAIAPGEGLNVGAGQLIFHNFENYDDLLNDTLKVENPQGIFTGKDLESDENYRFRLSQQVTAAESANRTAVRLAALAVPGVANIIVDEFARGIGTYDLLIQSVTPSVSTNLVNAVEAAIELVTAMGVIGKAKGPIETGLTFEVSVRYTSTLTTSVVSEIQSKITAGLTEYVNNLDIAEEFVINEAVQRVLEVDDRIKDIGVATKPFDKITIYRQTELEDNKVTQNLVKNYVPADQERIILEPSVSNPIVLNTV